jgi:hypothetical protein
MEVTAREHNSTCGDGGKDGRNPRKILTALVCTEYVTEPGKKSILNKWFVVT